MRRRVSFFAAAFAAAGALLAAAAQQTPGVQPPRDTSARPAASAAAATGRISGRVLDAATGRPMKLARVVLNAPEGGSRAAQSDETGAFDFLDLRAGRYTLTVSKAGYIGLSYGQRRPLQPGTPLQLDEGQHLKGIEFRMPRGGVIAGTVSDEIGDPMPGIAVRLLRFQYQQGTRQLVPAGGGQTDDRGAYRVWGLNPGEYYVSAVAPMFNARGLPGPAGRGGRGGPASPVGDVDIGYAPTYFPGVPSVVEATPVTVGLGAEALNVDFNVLLVRTAQVSGRATNADGTPVTRGNVNLTPEGPGGRGLPGFNFGSRINWDGAFSIANVPPGRYVVRARGTDDVSPQYAQVPLTVAGEDLTDVVVVLAPGATLTGSVSLQATQSAEPADVTQIRVSAQSADGAAGGGNINARVEKDGRFTLAGIPIGPHLIRAQGPRGWSLKAVVVDGRETIDTPLDIRAGQRITGASLLLTDRQSEIGGLVADRQRRPITDFTVLAFPTDSSLWLPFSRYIATARPDQNGRYQLRGLPAGSYYLAIVDPEQPGQWLDPAFLELQRPDAARITLADGGLETHDFVVDQ